MKTLTAIYDLEVSPITFDFAKFLLLAEQYRQQVEFTHLSVLVVAPSAKRLTQLIQNYTRLSTHAIDESFLIKRVALLLQPLVKLVNSDAKYEFVSAREWLSERLSDSPFFPRDYSLMHPSQAYRIENVIDVTNAGEVLPSLVVQDVMRQAVIKSFKESALDPAKTLAIFLRQTPYETSRNSCLNDWILFAEKRIDEGYQVAWFDDVESTLQTPLIDMPGVVINEDDIVVRAAFIDRCAACFFVNGGMATLARYNHSVVSATFKLCDQNSPATSKQFWSNKGYAVGQRLHFLSPLHHNEWREDSYTVIEDVWDSQIKPKLGLSVRQKQNLIDNWTRQIREQAYTRNIEVVEQASACSAIYVWGCGGQAKRAITALEKAGFDVSGVVDSYKYGNTFEGFTLLHPNQIDSQSTQSVCFVIAIGEQPSSAQFAKIITYCQQALRFSCQLYEFKSST